MNSTLNPTKQDIQDVLDEFFQTGYSLEDFCSLTGHEQAELQSWIQDYHQQVPADPNAFLEVNVIGTPQIFPYSKARPAPCSPELVTSSSTIMFPPITLNL